MGKLGGSSKDDVIKASRGRGSGNDDRVREGSRNGQKVMT